MALRLQKYMAQCGVASRRKSEELIKAGRVKVNDITIRELGTKIKEDEDVVTVDGKIIRPRRLAYIILHKPPLYITSRSDPQGRPTVLDLLPEHFQHLYPVGRLDWDSQGLVFLTNDGGLAYRIAHPRFEIEKSYLVKTAARVDEEGLKRLRQGIMLADGLTAPAKIGGVKRQGEFCRVEITIHEGRNRQIRRMFAALDWPVLGLKRIRIGPLKLSGLAEGQYRHLENWEIKALQEI